MLTSSFGLIEFGCRTEKPKSNAVLTAFDLTRRRTRVRRAVRFFLRSALNATAPLRIVPILSFHTIQHCRRFASSYVIIRKYCFILISGYNSQM